MAGPEDFLQPGERLLFSDDDLCGPPAWLALMIATLPPFIYFVGWAFAPRFFEHPWSVAIGIASYLLLLFGPEIFLMAGWFGRWRIAVTDRRILLRPGFLALRSIEVPLPKSRLASHEWRDGRLLLMFDDEALALRCSKSGADKVVEAVANAHSG